MARITKERALELLTAIAEDIDEAKDSDRIRSIQQICLMEGWNEQSAIDIDFDKLVLNLGKQKRK